MATVSKVSEVRFEGLSAPVDWLWDGHLARAKFHLLAGAPGTGKTTISLSLAAAVTSGGQWPDGSPIGAAGDVVIWTGEDGIADTLLPRFMASGGDRARVHFIDGISTQEHARFLTELEKIAASQ